MQFDIVISGYSRSRWSARLALMVVLNGPVIGGRPRDPWIGFNVAYRWATAIQVQHIPGSDITTPAVLIQTPEHFRILRTSDRLLVIQTGDKVCVSRRKPIARRWTRCGLARPGYCRNEPMLIPSGPMRVFRAD